MALPIQIGLVADHVEIPLPEVTTVAAALSKQVAQDFSRYWKVQATVNAFAQLENVPIDTWPIIVQAKLDDPGAAGYHQTKHGQPYALVEYGEQWSLTASHELLEMLGDPFGNRLKAGMLLDQAVQLGLKAGRVNYLVEVCDPCEAAANAYHINGVLVSDFYTPHFFDPVKSHARYSFTGAIDAPRKILDEGYITWQDPSNQHVMQLCMFPDDTSDKVPHVIDLNTNQVFQRLLDGGRSLRAAVDAVTKTPLNKEGVKPAIAGEVRQHADAASAAQSARAAALRAEIEENVARHRRAREG